MAISDQLCSPILYCCFSGRTGYSDNFSAEFAAASGGKSLKCFQCVGDDEKIGVGIFNFVRLPADNECADPFAAEFGYVSLTVVRTGGEGNEYCLIVIPRKTAAVGKQSANGALRVARLFSSYDFGDFAK